MSCLPGVHGTTHEPMLQRPQHMRHVQSETSELPNLQTSSFIRQVLSP
jgi:hypothetical protein